MIDNVILSLIKPAPKTALEKAIDAVELAQTEVELLEGGITAARLLLRDAVYQLKLLSEEQAIPKSGAVRIGVE